MNKFVSLFFKQLQVTLSSTGHVKNWTRPMAFRLLTAYFWPCASGDKPPSILTGTSLALVKQSTCLIPTKRQQNKSEAHESQRRLCPSRPVTGIVQKPAKPRTTCEPPRSHVAQNGRRYHHGFSSCLAFRAVPCRSCRNTLPHDPLRIDAPSSALKHPGFDAPSVRCERPVGRHGSWHGSRLLLPWVGGALGGASAGWCCTSGPSRR